MSRFDAKGTPVTIRPAVESDIAFIESLLPRLAASDVRPQYYSEDEMVAGTARHPQDALAGASEDDLVVVAVDAAGNAAGFLWADTDTDYFTGERRAYIEEIAVVTDGNGTGQALMEHAENWARRRGFRYVSLSVRPANARAKALYGRRGYLVDVERMLKVL